MINYNKVAALSHLIKSFTYPFESWIVGGGAKYLLDLQEESPRDWDILIPFYTWGQACRIIPEGSPTNAFGGVKLDSIDVWCGDIGYFMGHANSYPQYAVNPKFMIYICADNQVERVKN